MDSIRLVYNNDLQSTGIPNSKFHSKIPNRIRLHLNKYIDMKHRKGKKVACREIFDWLRKKHAVYCSKHTLLRAIIDISLSYKPRKTKMCNNKFACLEQIRDYLISLHALLKLEKEG